MSKIKRLFSVIDQISVDSGMSRIRIMLSFLICYFIHGASLDNFRVLEMYKYNNFERKRIYTFRRQKKISDMLNKDATSQDLHTLMDKNLFNDTFRDFIHRDWYDSTQPDKEKLGVFLSQNSTFLIKPILSSQGKGIRLCSSADYDVERLYEETIKEKVILEGFIKQHKVLAKINPSSVNTIRLITAKYKGKVHVIHGGGIRCGGKDSFVDNFHNGGCAYPIDINTGIINGMGLTLGSKKIIIKHPSSNQIVCGIQIPNWEDIISTVCAAAQVMERVNYIAWDIAVLEDGCELIEANVNYPGTNIVQLNGFEAFEAVKSFLG